MRQKKTDAYPISVASLESDMITMLTHRGAGVVPLGRGNSPWTPRDESKGRGTGFAGTSCYEGVV